MVHSSAAYTSNMFCTVSPLDAFTPAEVHTRPHCPLLPQMTGSGQSSSVLTLSDPACRFWIGARHGRLFAAGHDGGTVLFRLPSLRPACCVGHTGSVFYQRQRELR